MTLLSIVLRGAISPDGLLSSWGGDGARSSENPPMRLLPSPVFQSLGSWCRIQGRSDDGVPMAAEVPSGNDKSVARGQPADLRSLNLKTEYDTEEDDLIADLYAPCLQVSEKYDRAVGYFRANIYRELGEDLLDFV